MSTEAEAPAIIGVVEAARILGVHRTTVVRWAKAGILPTVGQTAGVGSPRFSREAITNRAAGRT